MLKAFSSLRTKKKWEWKSVSKKTECLLSKKHPKYQNSFLLSDCLRHHSLFSGKLNVCVMVSGETLWGRTQWVQKSVCAKPAQKQRFLAMTEMRWKAREPRKWELYRSKIISSPSPPPGAWRVSHFEDFRYNTGFSLKSLYSTLKLLCRLGNITYQAYRILR